MKNIHWAVHMHRSKKNLLNFFNACAHVLYFFSFILGLRSMGNKIPPLAREKFGQIELTQLQEQFNFLVYCLFLKFGQNFRFFFLSFLLVDSFLIYFFVGRSQIPKNSLHKKYFWNIFFLNLLNIQWGMSYSNQKIHDFAIFSPFFQ